MTACNSIQSYPERNQRLKPCSEVHEFTWATAQQDRALGVAELSEVAEDEDPPCECIQVDVDEYDARSCPLHGRRSASARQLHEREATDIAAYYSGLGPAEDSLRASIDCSAHPSS